MQPCRHSTPFPLKSSRALSARPNALSSSMCAPMMTLLTILASSQAQGADPSRPSPIGLVRLHGQPVVVICQKGRKLSQGVAARLRHAGCRPILSKAERWPGRGRFSDGPSRPDPGATLRDGRSGSRARGPRSTDRLPLADPPLRRPRCRFPVRPDFRSPGCGGAFFSDTFRYRRRSCLLEPSRGTLHLRCHGRGVRPSPPSP